MRDILNLFSKTSDAAIAIDSDQRIVLWNQSAEMLFGFTAKEALGRFCYDVIGSRTTLCHLSCQKNCFAQTMALKQQVVPTHDLQVHTKTGRTIWLSVTTIVVPSQWRDLCLLIHLFRDVSRQKEMEHFVKQLIDTAQKLAKSFETRQSEDSGFALSATDLTAREREVLSLLAAGTSTKDVATELFISPATVRNHIHNILAKLGVQSRLEAVVLALKQALI
jgi:PAS domain S-box-containing protein